jgi:hypothetical protein
MSSFATSAWSTTWPRSVARRHTRQVDGHDVALAARLGEAQRGLLAGRADAHVGEPVDEGDQAPGRRAGDRDRGEKGGAVGRGGGGIEGERAPAGGGRETRRPGVARLGGAEAEARARHLGARRHARLRAARGGRAHGEDDRRDREQGQVPDVAHVPRSSAAARPRRTDRRRRSAERPARAPVRRAGAGR